MGAGRGVKLDLGKARWDLLPWRAVAEVVNVLTFGAAKYSDNNWQVVLEEGGRERYFAAAQRHLNAWWLEIENNDEESGLHHLAHAVCCILFLLAEEIGYDPKGENP